MKNINVNIKVFAISAIVIILVVGLVAGSLHPESWADIATFTMPTLTILFTLIKVQDYHIAVNSKMDDLLDLTRRSAKAEGKLEGQQGQ